jgi:cytochrome c biogenesis protein CcmG, thiol:disulfide interchange protein DsbE
LHRSRTTNDRRLSPLRAAGIACIAILVASAVAALSGCGASDPKSSVTSPAQFKSLRHARGALGRLYARPATLLPGGPSAFKRELTALRGHGVVVNKWASWCGPCRFEFPFFQRQAAKRGARVAFLGVDAEDGWDAGRRFLKKFPVPYPSFFDAHSDIAAVFRGDRVFPTTAYYDSKGALVYTKQGGYASESVLARDIARYAR